MILFVEFGTDFARHTDVTDVVSKFVDANVASEVMVFFQFEQVFLAAGGQESAHAAGPLVAGQSVVLGQLFALVLPPFGEVGGDLVAADNVQFGTGGHQ